MTKRSKAYRAAAEKIQSGVLYTPAELSFNQVAKI